MMKLISYGVAYLIRWELCKGPLPAIRFLKVEGCPRRLRLVESRKAQGLVVTATSTVDSVRPAR